MDVEAALKAVGRILEGCDAQHQPSEALLDTLVKLLDRLQAPSDSTLNKVLALIPQLEERMRRIELNEGISAVKARPSRAKAQNFLDALAAHKEG